MRRSFYDADAANLAGAKDRAVTRDLIMAIMQEFSMSSLLEQADLLEEIAGILRRQSIANQIPTLERITARHADEPTHPAHAKLARHRAALEINCS
jgi:hypothetical protein